MEIAGRLADGRGVRVTVEGERVAKVAPAAEGEADADVLIGPGLLDLQVNGYRGLDVNASDLDVTTIRDLSRTLLQRGVTGFCPTVITASPERIEHALRTIAAARDADPVVRRTVLGVHVEGPYLSPDDGARGAHDVNQLRDPDLREFERWQAAAPGLVRIVTLAPERAGAAEYVAAITAQGVVAALGHTNANRDEIEKCVAAGARLSTHLGNGAAALIPRHHNPIWPQLADEQLSASFIADGHHLPSEVIVAMLRAKGTAHSILVSDSAALAGAAPGRYRTPVGGAVVVEPDGRLTLDGTGYLAGAGRALDECVAWLVAHTPFGMADALRFAAANPARLLGEAHRGRVVVGARADLAVFVRAGSGAPWSLDTVVSAGQLVRAGVVARRVR